MTAEIGSDVPDTNCYVAGVGLSDCSCFQTQVGETECFGRSGATVIRITDNDRKNNISKNTTCRYFLHISEALVLALRILFLNTVSFSGSKFLLPLDEKA